MRVLPAMLLALLGLASPFGINAQTYPNAATYPVQNSDGLGPGPDNRAFGAAVHASDGKLFAAVNNTCGELFTTIPTSAGVTPTSSTLCLSTLCLPRCATCIAPLIIRLRFPSLSATLSPSR